MLIKYQKLWNIYGTYQPQITKITIKMKNNGDAKPLFLLINFSLKAL